MIEAEEPHLKNTENLKDDAVFLFNEEVQSQTV